MTLLRASEFVQRNARFVSDAPKESKARYFVRYPATATYAFFADDTWDLVQKVFKRGNAIERERRKK